MKVLKSLIDLIYPPRCPVCQAFLQDQVTVLGARELPFCEACFKNFTKITSPICFLCGRPFSDGTDQDRLCVDCLRKRPSYDMARAPYLYDGALMKAIHELKYAQRSHLADSLGLLLALFAQSWTQEMKGSLVMPVPLHPRRLRARGFNQSLLLARCVAAKAGAELDFLSLRRTRFTYTGYIYPFEGQRPDLSTFSSQEPLILYYSVKDQGLFLRSDRDQIGV
jgi:predicted amidophosphoribosyltransferase